MNRSFVFLLCAALAAALTAPALAQTSPAAQERISLNMPEVPLVDALRMTAKLADLNLIVDSNVKGTINLFFDDVPWRDAWNAILQTGGLKSEDRNGILYVYPVQEKAAPADAQETRIIQLKYIALGANQLTSGAQNAAAGSTNTQANNSSQSYGSQSDSGPTERGKETNIGEILTSMFEERGLKSSLDDRTNQIVISGPASLLDEVETMVAALDQPAAQILIEAKLLQVRSDALDQLGIDWGGIYTISNQGGMTLTSDRTRTQPAGGVSETGTESGNFSSALNSFNVTVSALVDRGDARILSSPRVVTLNNQEAFISSGQEIQVPSGLDINGNATYRERRVTLELGVTPRVLDGDQINMAIRVRNDSINYSQQQISGVPPLNINTVESIVTLSNLDTVIIGGIIVQQDTYNTRKTPFLADIPLLGQAFRSRKTQKENSELVIMITPAIVTGADPEALEGAAAPALELFNQAKPAHGETALQNETPDRQDNGGSTVIRKGSKILFRR
ncbi:MAG: hypothetical protein GC154_05625 [bacterium]|nr:hypothetical protein [bacterium]